MARWLIILSDEGRGLVFVTVPHPKAQLVQGTPNQKTDTRQVYFINLK